MNANKNNTTKLDKIKIESTPIKNRRKKKNKEQREFIDWLKTLDNNSFTRQGDKIKIHLSLIPSDKSWNKAKIAWNKAKDDWNIEAVKRGFEKIQ